MQIIDDFISPYYQDIVEKQLLDKHFPYFLGKYTVDEEYYFQKQISNAFIKEAPQFVHTFIYEDQTISPFWPAVAPLAFKFIEHLGNNYSVARCKANINLRDANPTSENYFTPHVDYSDKDMITAIYYVGDFDGNTFFFDDDLNVINQVSPKKGRLVYFQANQLHAGQAPIEAQSRFVINFNFRRT